MSYVLSIDPGLNHCGLALWNTEGVLVRAWLARAATKPGDDISTRWRSVAQAVGTGNVERLLIERPQIYRMSRGDPNDLLNISAVVGCLTQVFDCMTVTYLPRAWKGNIKKEAMISRIRERLSKEESERVECKPASLAHNIWDAVGIGLYHFGRLGKCVKSDTRNA